MMLVNDLLVRVLTRLVDFRSPRGPWVLSPLPVLTGSLRTGLKRDTQPRVCVYLGRVQG